MEGGIDSNVAATYALLADTARAGRGGYGYGGGEGGWGCAGPWATPSANAERIESGNRASASAFENLLDQNQFNNIKDDLASCCNRTLDQGVNSEFRTGDRLRDIEREMNSIARTQTAQINDFRAEAAKCCCDARVQSCEDKAEILAAIADSKATALAVESRGIERTLNATQAELISLKTQVACGCNCPS